MDLKPEILKRIKKQEQQIRSLESRIAELRTEISHREADVRDAKARLEEQREFLRLVDPTSISLNDPRPKSARAIRANSQIGKALDYLRSAGKPMHVDAILQGIGLNQDKKMSLTSSLSRYASKREMFTSLGNNTYGLLEFGINATGENPGGKEE